LSIGEKVTSVEFKGPRNVVFGVTIITH